VVGFCDGTVEHLDFHTEGCSEQLTIQHFLSECDILNCSRGLVKGLAQICS
jgi:hypothetical protein